jgi:hypothetical protein
VLPRGVADAVALAVEQHVAEAFPRLLAAQLPDCLDALGVERRAA